MFKNYLKIALRNLLKNKVYSIVNILSLVIGLTCGILIILYVLYEFSYDRHHQNAENLYRLGRETTTADRIIREPLSSAPTAPALMQDFPEVINAARFGHQGRIVIRHEDKEFYEEHIAYADPSVFDLFNFAMIKGDPKAALVKPYSVVITQETAQKYFGTDMPVGKVLRFNNRHDYLVTGVLKNIPDNSHFEFDMLCSIETLYARKNPNLNNWLSFEYMTYLLLKENTDYTQFEQKLDAFIEKYIGENFKVQGKSIRFFLHPLSKIQLYSHLEGYPPGRITQVYIFSIFALCIIAVACINFISLATARSTNRAKEVGIRKVVGANRSKLIFQFLSEALLLSFISLAIALFLVELILPAFNTIVRQQLTLNPTDNPWLLVYFFGLAVIVGIISGSYPAFYLSQFRPTYILKGEVILSTRKVRLRSILVVFQFFASTVFIIHTSIFGIQIDNLRNIDLGFNKKDIVVIPIVDEEIKHSIKLFKKEVKHYTAVENVSATSTLPGWYIPRNLKIPQGYSKEQMQLMDDINVDHDFIPTLEIKMADGRNFSEGFTTDREEGIIINETAVKKYGWDNPIGKTIKYSTGQDKFASGMVCGVVKDFHLASLHRVIEPLFISNNPEKINYLLIRIKPEDLQITIDQIKTRWHDIYPHHPFEFTFLEHSYDHYFRVIEKVQQVFYYFIFLTIFIACLGIFALAIYNAEHRIKEIGIRKVLGASTIGIILSLNKEIVWLVLIAITLALLFIQIPLLDPRMFLPYFVDVNFTLYLKSALIVIIIAFSTILYQSIKTALANPLNSLRHE